MNDFRITFIYKSNNDILTKDIDVGLIQKLSTAITPSTTTNGIPTQPSQNAFAFDYGVTKSYTFSFRRITPKNPIDNFLSDSTQWSNGFWVYVMKHYVVNRWQTETDGIKIRYISPSAVYYPNIDSINAFVNSFSANTSAGDNQSISGSIKFKIGGSAQVKDVAKHVVIYDSNYASYVNTKEAREDVSNIVNVTNKDYIGASPVIPTWLEHAKEYGIYQQSDDLGTMGNYFRWNTKADGTGINYTPDRAINSLPDGTLTLYARYNRTAPPNEGSQ